MGGWLVWITRWSQRPHVQALVNQLAPMSRSPFFPALGGAVALAAAVTMSLPTAPLVSALVALRPTRWRMIVCWAVLGSAIGTTLVTFAFGKLSLPWLNNKMPELMNSRYWQELVEWVARYGWWVLAAIAATPLAQLPALALAAMLGMPLSDVFVAVAVGKAFKYSLVARVTYLMAQKAAARAPHAIPANPDWTQPRE
jgi:membrane protein YqaA with SNARE-associated domain